MTQRAKDELRKLTFDIGFQKHPKGSALIGFGNTRVLCSASVQPGAPRWKVEIQRLIGRSLRAVVDMEAIGPNSIYVDCDVIDADGGTRCASITGGAVALYEALRTLKDEGEIESIPMREMVAAGPRLCTRFNS